MRQLFFSLVMMCAFSLTAYSSGADEKERDFKVKVYPNPVEKNGSMTIETPKSELGEVTVFLYNTVGQLVNTIKTSNEKVEFIAPDASGIYLVRIVEKQKVVAVEKIVVKE